MGNKEQYRRGLRELLDNPKIRKENKDLFKAFFEFEERKLKRSNNLRELDESCYQTLKTYCSRFKNVERWFKGKAWANLTKEDIQKVYDDLEDGKLKTNRGKPYKDRKSYYNKIFKSKPFAMVGKDEIAKEVIEFTRKEVSDVRFFGEETFQKLVDVMISPSHKLLAWLSWDLGENINSLLQLKKRDFTRQVDKDSKEVEYHINLRKEILKRSRKSRGETTLYKETSKWIDIVLNEKFEVEVIDKRGRKTKKLVALDDEDFVFQFEYGQANKILARAQRITNAQCIPNGEKVTWKDFRSSMACYLLKKGWTTNEINSRLGHTPSSSVLDRYVNFLALGSRQSKKKLFDGTLSKVQEELEEAKQREKLTNQRLEKLQQDMVTLMVKFGVAKDMNEHNKIVDEYLSE